VVLVDAGGSVVWWSGAMQRHLDSAGLRWSAGMPCCAALCEGSSGSDGGCLTREALAAPQAPVARRWRAGEGAGAVAATITGRPLGGGRGIVAFELRFAAGRTAASGEPDVDVSALGRLSLTVAGRPRGGDWLQQRPGQVFRYLLASRAGPQRSEAIAAALWPDRGPSAIANVRYCIFKLREQLGERGDPAVSLVVRDAAGYRIDLRRLRLDVDEFQRKATAGIAAHRRADDEEAEETLTEALALYRGDFLADDPYADWAFTEREYLRAVAHKGLAALAQIAVAKGRLAAASAHLQRLAQLEPFDSHVHQMLIEVCLRRGRRTEALRHYHALRVRLERTFGERPDFDVVGVAATLSGNGSESSHRGRRADRWAPASLILDAS
jgi:DNA-binding SARP family transcriptional activator